MGLMLPLRDKDRNMPGAEQLLTGFLTGAFIGFLTSVKSKLTKSILWIRFLVSNFINLHCNTCITLLSVAIPGIKSVLSSSYLLVNAANYTSPLHMTSNSCCAWKLWFHSCHPLAVTRSAFDLSNPTMILPLTFIYVYDILATTSIDKLFPLIRHVHSDFCSSLHHVLTSFLSPHYHPFTLWRAGKIGFGVAINSLWSSSFNQNESVAPHTRREYRAQRGWERDQEREKETLAMSTPHVLSSWRG